MTPIQSPTSPSFESHPATPMSPSFNHPLDSGLSSPISPRLKVNTSFGFNPLSFRNSPILGQPPRSTALQPAHNRGTSSVSTLSFPSPTEAIFQHMPPTPRTPGPNVAFNSLFSPGSPVREDGRQSRMAMRSPIVERILSLPLRVHTNGASTPLSEPRFPNPPNSQASTSPAEGEDAMSISSPTTPSPCRPDGPPTPVIQISAPPPPRTASHTRNSSTTTLKPTSQGIKKRTSHRPPPPTYHLQTLPSLESVLNNPKPPTQPTLNAGFPTPAHRQAYTTAVTHLATPLVPLISVTTGLPHPQFPRSLLQYHLLTHTQLDDLARWYHQTAPATEESWMYPAWIPPYTLHAAVAAGHVPAAEVPREDFAGVSLATKRRRWGRFIGLRGCESPTTTWEESEESLVERMEREWVRARERAREEEWRGEKGWRGRW